MARKTRIYAPTAQFILKDAQGHNSKTGTKPTGNEPTLIYLTIRINTKRLVWSTSESVEPKDWNFTNRRPIVRARRVDLSELKARLDGFATEAVGLFNDWNLADRVVAAECDHNKFKEELSYRTKKASRPSSVKKGRLDFTNFLTLAKTYRDIKKTLPDVKHGTWKVTNNHVNLLTEYAETLVDSPEDAAIEFDEVDDFWLGAFKAWLLDFKDHKPQTVHKVMISIREIARRADRKNLMKYDADFRKWASFEFKRRRQAYLTVGEFNKMTKLDLSDQPRLERVRDMFLVGVATAQRWSDYSRFTPANFHPLPGGGYRFTIDAQKKTRGEASGPVMEFAWPLLEKYGLVGPAEITYKPISASNFRKYLKEIAKLAFPDSTFVIHNDGREADDIGVAVPKWSVIGTHSARRTAVGMLRSYGNTDAQIMEVTGHKSLAELDNYDNREAEEKALEMLENARSKKSKLRIA